VKAWKNISHASYSFKVSIFVQQGICCYYITKRLSNTICHIFKWVMTWPDPTKRPVPTLKCWTQLVHNIWIRLKQALLQNTEIWTLYNLLRVIIGTCINIALVILLLYLVLENCVFYVTMKKETIRKSNTGFAIFEIVLDF